jgi:hypothetical protein
MIFLSFFKIVVPWCSGGGEEGDVVFEEAAEQSLDGDKRVPRSEAHAGPDNTGWPPLRFTTPIFFRHPVQGGKPSSLYKHFGYFPFKILETSLYSASTCL